MQASELESLSLEREWQEWYNGRMRTIAAGGADWRCLRGRRRRGEPGSSFAGAGTPQSLVFVEHARYLEAALASAAARRYRAG